MGLLGRILLITLLVITSSFIIIASLSQEVGTNLGSLVFITMGLIWPILTMLRFENYGRIGYLICGPFTIWLGYHALLGAEFLSGILFFLLSIITLVYLFLLIFLLLPKSTDLFKDSSDKSKKSFGKGFSILLLSISGFVFGWWWSNSSTIFNFILISDFQGILISVVGVTVSLLLIAIIRHFWWPHTVGSTYNLIFGATGVILLEHAICYNVITFLVYIGGAEDAFKMTYLIIIGRYFFALFILLLSFIIKPGLKNVILSLTSLQPQQNQR